MKKIFIMFFLGVCASYVYAVEQVSTISFNPSRLGQYSYLKVNKNIDLKGGLRVNDDGGLNFAISNGGIIKVSGSGVGLEVPTVTTRTGDDTNISISMPETSFQQAGSVGVYTRGGSVPGTAMTSVEMKGGSSLDMSNGTASYAANMGNYAGSLDMRATELFQADQKVTVSGASVTTNTGTESGMVLGNIRVPVPSSSYNRYGWKWLEGANGKIRVFALCAASDSACDTGATSGSTDHSSSNACAWEITSDEVDIPTAYLCGQSFDTNCGNTGTKPSCGQSNKGATWSDCVVYDVCPGGGIRKDETIYTCKCS